MKDRSLALPGEPFTVEHFTTWAGRLLLRSGEPWIIEDFQAAFVDDFFDEGFNECWLVIPEGNAKTTLTMGLALYHCQFTRWASVAVAAASRDQAKTDWDTGAGFIRRSPRALDGFTFHPGLRQIRFRPGDSEIQIWAADSRTGDGIDPTMALIDELHRHRDLELYRTWRGKLEKSGGKIVTISTAGEPGSEFELTRERIRQEADAIRGEFFTRAVKGNLVMHEWAVPESADVEDMDVVKAANPLAQITPQSLAEVRGGPSQTLSHWRRFNCNLPTRSDAAAIMEVEWYGAEVSEAIPEGVPVDAGLDVAWKWDTTALVPLWIRDPEYRLLGPATVLTPPRDGTSLDPLKVEAALIALHDRNPIATLVMDPTRAEQLASWAEATLGCSVIARNQLNADAAKDYERFMEALREGWLKHVADANLTRHCLNAIARPLPGGNARFDRPHQSRFGTEQDMRVIDALSAAAMVHSVAIDAVPQDREPMIAWA